MSPWALHSSFHFWTKVYLQSSCGRVVKYCSLRPSQRTLWKMSKIETAEVKTKVQNWLGFRQHRIIPGRFPECNSTFRECNSCWLLQCFLLSWDWAVWDNENLEWAKICKDNTIAVSFPLAKEFPSELSTDRLRSCLQDHILFFLLSLKCTSHLFCVSGLSETTSVYLKFSTLEWYVSQ